MMIGTDGWILAKNGHWNGVEGVEMWSSARILRSALKMVLLSPSCLLVYAQEYMQDPRTNYDRFKSTSSL